MGVWDYGFLETTSERIKGDRMSQKTMGKKYVKNIFWRTYHAALFCLLGVWDVFWLGSYTLFSWYATFFFFCDLIRNIPVFLRKENLSWMDGFINRNCMLCANVIQPKLKGKTIRKIYHKCYFSENLIMTLFKANLFWTVVKNSPFWDWL